MNEQDDAMIVTLRLGELRTLIREVVDTSVQRALDPMQQKWVDIKAVASHAGVSVKTVRRWITGGMPATRVGHDFRFRLADVDTWLAQHAVQKAG